jgi:hypothetical protein
VNNRLIAPPSATPRSAAHDDFVASITARTSSIRSSSGGAPSTGSDEPVPRLSKTITRANALIRSKLGYMPQ